MSTLLVSSPEIPTLGALLERLGDIPASRVRYFPLPGTATVEDVIAIHDHEKRLCELVDGVLVEKPVGLKESMVAIAIAYALKAFVTPRRLGYVAGEAGMVQLVPALVRGPDVSYFSSDRLPDGVPDEAYPVVVPNLVVEVLSRSNTTREMERKRQEYFSAGVLVVWEVDLRRRTVEAYTSPDQFIELTASDVLDGGTVLPGFSLPLASIFAEIDRKPAEVI